MRKKRKKYSGSEMKKMAEELLGILLKDNGVSEMQAILNKLQTDYNRAKKNNYFSFIGIALS